MSNAELLSVRALLSTFFSRPDEKLHEVAVHSLLLELTMKIQCSRIRFTVQKTNCIMQNSLKFWRWCEEYILTWKLAIKERNKNMASIGCCAIQICCAWSWEMVTLWSFLLTPFSFLLMLYGFKRVFGFLSKVVKLYTSYRHLLPTFQWYEETGNVAKNIYLTNKKKNKKTWRRIGSIRFDLTRSIHVRTNESRT